jgi:uncharacterized protein YkwD
MMLRAPHGLALLLTLVCVSGCTDGPGRHPSGAEPDARVLITLTDGSLGSSDTFVPLLPDGNAPMGDTQQPPPPPVDSGTPPAPDSGVSLSAMEKDLFDAINAARAKEGLNTLVPDAMLMCAARLAAKVVPPTGSCGHVGADGSWPNDRAESCGMSSAAAWKVNEIAAGPGFTDGADAVWGWSQSSGHWWGLTHPQATKIGVAATTAGCYWAVFDCCIAGS